MEHECPNCETTIRLPDPPTHRENIELKMAMEKAEVQAGALEKKNDALKAEVAALKRVISGSRTALTDQIQRLQTRNKDLEKETREATTQARSAAFQSRKDREATQAANKDLEDALEMLEAQEKKGELERKSYRVVEAHAKKKGPVESCKCPVCHLRALLNEERSAHAKSRKQIKDMEGKERAKERKAGRPRHLK